MKILIADDEAMLIEYLQRSLQFDNHRVDVAKDGLEAYRKASTNRYDAVIMDVIMPAKNGVEVTSDLREAGVKTPILILSSRDGEEARVQGLDAGADDYMIKPFGYKELSARLRSLERRATNKPKEVISIGNVVINPGTRQVTRDGKTIALRPKEFALLTCLAQNAGQAVSKTHLLHKVWGVSVSNASTRLQVCIKSLREKLDLESEEPLIRNVRGYGYMMNS